VPDRHITQHLTQAEQRELMAEIMRRRTPETFQAGKWSVSPLNRTPDVLGRPLPESFPLRVTVRDITLRTIEQAPGVTLGEEQRQMLAESLYAAGVRSFVMAWLSTPRALDNPLRDEVARLRALGPDLELCALGASREQVDAGIDAGVDVFHVYGPAVPAFHTVYGAYGRQILRAHWRGEDWRRTVRYPKDESENLAFMQEEVSRVRAAGMRAGAFCSMLHYATPD
jgi:hypothetical protein